MQRGGSTAFVWLIWPCPSTRTPALGVRKFTILVDLSLVIITIYLMLFNIIFFNNVIWRFRFIYMYQPLNQMICRDVSYQHFHISSSVTGRLVIFINVWNGRCSGLNRNKSVVEPLLIFIDSQPYVLSTQVDSRSMTSSSSKPLSEHFKNKHR